MGGLAPKFCRRRNLLALSALAIFTIVNNFFSITITAKNNAAELTTIKIGKQPLSSSTKSVTTNSTSTTKAQNDEIEMLDGFPVTQFTTHVLELVSKLQYVPIEKIQECSVYFTLRISPPETLTQRLPVQEQHRQNFNFTVCIPTLDTWYDKNKNVHDGTSFIESMIGLVTRTFNSTTHSPNRVLPTTSTAAAATDGTIVIGLGYSLADKTSKFDDYNCLISSSPKGMHTFYNYLEIKRAHQSRHEEFGVIPWSERNPSTAPIFRGSCRAGTLPKLSKIASQTKEQQIEKETSIYRSPDHENDNSDNHERQLHPVLDYVLSKCSRCQAVYLSNLYPTLVDAKFASDTGCVLFDRTSKRSSKYMNVMKHNATNGLHSLLSFNSIPPEEYYTRYRSTLVLCGIGAAFRLSVHFSTEMAVLLQECRYEEWFTKYLQPWVHYIPLGKMVSYDDSSDNCTNLDNFTSTLQWIQNNPQKVKEIASNGRHFYEKFLSFDRMEEHIYELLYRLALSKINKM